MLAYSVILHPLEDGPAGEHSADDDTEPFLSKHNVRGAPRCISSSSYSNSDIRFLQSRRIVHAISCHSTDVLHLLQLLDNLIFVLCIKVHNFRMSKQSNQLLLQCILAKKKLLQCNSVFMQTWKDAGEAVGLLDQVIHRNRSSGFIFAFPKQSR